MFDFVRKHTRVMQFILFLLIFPSFVLFGLEGYNRFNEKGEAVAKVFIAGSIGVMQRPISNVTSTAERVSGFRLTSGLSMAANLLSSVDGRAMVSTADHARSVVLRLRASPSKWLAYSHGVPPAEALAGPGLRRRD